MPLECPFCVTLNAKPNLIPELAGEPTADRLAPGVFWTKIEKFPSESIIPETHDGIRLIDKSEACVLKFWNLLSFVLDLNDVFKKLFVFKYFLVTFIF